MSVAIIPMAADYGWSASTAGLVQSAFFAGYALTQIPAGYLAARVGGAAMLPAGVGLWSAATAAVPLVAPTLPGLLAARVMVGLGEGLAPTAATDVIARAAPPSGRARMTSFVFGGLHAGSLAGLLAAPPLIDAFGWAAVFYGFGAVGGVWALWWARAVLPGIAVPDPALAAALGHDDGGGGGSGGGDGGAGAGDAPPTAKPHPTPTDDRVPWRAFLRSPPYRALAATHFANNWLHYVLMAWLPTFFTQTAALSLSQASAAALLPPAAALAVATVAGPASDAALTRGWSVEAARKAAQAAAFLAPAACLAGVGLWSLPAGDGAATLALVTAALGLSSLSLVGLYCNHADLDPRYAPLLLGGTTAVGAVPGVLGVAATGRWLDATGGDWGVAMFAPTAVILVAGAAIFTTWGSADRQDWAADDGPLWVERAWADWRAREAGGEEGGEGDAPPPPPPPSKG